MKEREIEIVRYPQMSCLSIFLDTVSYRTPHVHEEFELLWILDGGMDIGGIRPQIRVSSGDILLFDPGRIHEFASEKNCTFLCYQISRDLLRSYPGIDAVRFDDPRIEENKKVKSLLAEAARSYLSQEKGYELTCPGLMAQVFGELIRVGAAREATQEELAERQTRSQRIEKIIRYVDRNYMHKIRLTDLAEEEGLSMGYLSHFVKEELGVSFQEYVQTVRFNAARKMIETDPDLKMLDICYLTGFSDYRYFSRIFQQRLGMTPEEYSKAPRRPVEEETRIHRSVHSLEQFYSRGRSLELLEKYLATSN